MSFTTQHRRPVDVNVENMNKVQEYLAVVEKEMQMSGANAAQHQQMNGPNASPQMNGANGSLQMNGAESNNKNGFATTTTLQNAEGE